MRMSCRPNQIYADERADASNYCTELEKRERIKNNCNPDFEMLIEGGFGYL